MRARRTASSLSGLLLLGPPFMAEGGYKLDGFARDRFVDAESLRGLPLHPYFGPPKHPDLYGWLFPVAAVHRVLRCGHQFEDCMARVSQAIWALARVTTGRQR